MEFTPTLFTVEVDAIPRLVFEARLRRDAEAICRDWWQREQQSLSSNIRLDDGRPRLKLRLARPAERAEYASTLREQDGSYSMVRLAEPS